MSLVQFSQIEPPWWDDMPCIVVGTGPSMKGFDFSKLQGLGYILAVKEAVWDLPFADACFGLDLGWMRRKQDDLRKLKMPLYLSVPEGGKYHEQHIENAIYIRRLRRADSFSEDPRYIESGGNSGFGAINLAFLKRAKLIFAFGYDYQGAHYCAERYTHLPKDHNRRYLPRWGRAFHRVARQMTDSGVKMIVASMHTTIPCFERMTKHAALERLHRLRSERGGSLRSGQGEPASSLHYPDAHPRPGAERSAGEGAILAEA